MEAEHLGEIFYAAFAGAMKLPRQKVVIMCLLERLFGTTGAINFMIKRTIGTFAHLEVGAWRREMDSRILPALSENPSCPWVLVDSLQHQSSPRRRLVVAEARSRPSTIYSKRGLARASREFEFTIAVIAPNESHTRSALQNFHRKVDCSLYQACFLEGWEEIKDAFEYSSACIGAMPVQLLHGGTVAVCDCTSVFHDWWAYSSMEEERILTGVLSSIFSYMSYPWLFPKGEAEPRIFECSRAQLLRCQGYRHFPKCLQG